MSCLGWEVYSVPLQQVLLTLTHFSPLVCNLKRGGKDGGWGTTDDCMSYVSELGMEGSSPNLINDVSKLVSGLQKLEETGWVLWEKQSCPFSPGVLSAKPMEGGRHLNNAGMHTPIIPALSRLRQGTAETLRPVWA